MKKWGINKSQKKLLNNLFDEIKDNNIKNILDIGGGRTSVLYLTDRFKKIKIKTLIYPGDERKIKPILECVKNENYEIIENDIKKIKNKKVDIVLAHLFLGEAEKFGNNKFKEIINALLKIKTKFLVMINREDDEIDYFYLLKQIIKKGRIIKIVNQKTEREHECLGILIKIIGN